MTPPYRSLTLGLYPTSRGFGWIAFEGPFAPYDWGIVRTDRGEKARKYERSLARIEKVLRRLQPEAIVLETFDGRSAIRSPRIQKLCKAVVAFAADQGVQVAIYNRKNIESCFKEAGAKTRDEIAAAVARHVPALRHRLPAKRKKWESEDRGLALFCAAALVMTHYAFGANDLFERLKQAA